MELLEYAKNLQTVRHDLLAKGKTASIGARQHDDVRAAALLSCAVVGRYCRGDRKRRTLPRQQSHSHRDPGDRRLAS